MFAELVAIGPVGLIPSAERKLRGYAKKKRCYMATFYRTCGVIHRIGDGKG